MRFILFGIASMATMLATQAIHLPQNLNGNLSKGIPYKNPFVQDSMLLEYDQSGGLSLPQKDEINAQSHSTGETGTSSSIENLNSLSPTDHSKTHNLSQVLQDVRDKN